jgi:glucokinase
MTATGAVDIGGTKIAVGIVDATGRLLASRQKPTKEAEAYHDGLQFIAAMLRQMAWETGAVLDGIGIGATGPVDPLTGRFGELDFLPRWSGESLVDDLTRGFGVPVALENDADAAALGEASWGAGRDYSRLIYVTIGTGIGGGIILNGELYRGVEYAHPEIGHQVVDVTGPPCSCGLSGCWEAMAAGPAMAQWMLSEPGYRSNGELTAKRICELAYAGDATARRAVEREAFYLGLGLANLVNLFTPEAIILGGSLMKSSSLFFEGMQKTMQRGCRFVPLDKVKIALASLGEDANLIGAARAWHNRFSQDRSTVVNS